MFKYITSIILIGSAIASFFFFTNPIYKNVLTIREQIDFYNQALTNSKALETERDKLTQKYNSFDPEKLDRLEKLLPDNVDNIRLILEIEKIASPYGMAIKDVRYDTTSETKDSTQIVGKNVKAVSSKSYGILNFEFSTQGTYNNFINFIKDLENNLRIVDISSIQFSSSSSSIGLNPKLLEAYKYNFSIKTYWLKN